MSIKVIEKVFKHTFADRRGRGDHAAKLVMLKLADCCNDEGKSCFPSVRTIAFQTDLTPRTVLNKLAWLEGKKYIKIKKGSATANNSYRIMVDRLTENVMVVKRFHHLKAVHQGGEIDDMEVVNGVQHNHQRTVMETTISCEQGNMRDLVEQDSNVLEQLRQEENDPDFTPF